MREGVPNRRTILEGVATGIGLSLVGAGSATGVTDLERRYPASEEITIESGSTVLFEAEPPTDIEPNDVEWDGGGDVDSAPLPGDYVYATGRPATFRTFESTGTYDVTCTYQGGTGTRTVEWTVVVESGGVSPPTIDLDTDPGADERVGVDETIEITASATATDGSLEHVIWIEGQNMTVPDVSSLAGREDSTTLTTSAGWISAGYPTGARAVSERGLMSEPEYDDGPAVRPLLTIDIVETNDPVDAGETLEVVAEAENTGDMMMAGDPTQQLEFIVGEDPVVADTETVSVDWNETERVTLEYETYPVEQDDEFPVRVEGADDTAERSVLVSGGDDGETSGRGVAIAIRETNDPVAAGETLTVTAELENTGSEETTRSLEFIVGHDPEVVETRSVTVGGSATETVTLTFETAAVERTQSFPVRIETDDASAERPVRVVGTADSQ